METINASTGSGLMVRYAKRMKKRMLPWVLLSFTLIYGITMLTYAPTDMPIFGPNEPLHQVLVEEPPPKRSAAELVRTVSSQLRAAAPSTELSANSAPRSSPSSSSSSASSGSSTTRSSLSSSTKEPIVLPRSIPENYTALLDALVKPRVYTQLNSIAITVVNKGMLDFCFNWLCTIRPFNFTNYVILASDDESYRALKAAGEPVTMLWGLPRTMENFLNFGTKNYHVLLFIRSLYVEYLLKSGYSVLLYDVDQIWTANPFPFFGDGTDDADAVGQNDDPNGGQTLCLGFALLKPTPKLLALWNSVQDYIEARIRSNRAQGSVDQGPFNHMGGKQGVKIRFLNRELFINGRSYFEHERKAVIPVQMHDNWVIGRDKKLRRFYDRRLWMLDVKAPEIFEPAPRCIYTDTAKLEPRPIPPKQLHEMVLTIKVMPALPRQAKFSALVESLLQADYSTKPELGGKESRLDLEIVLPQDKVEKEVLAEAEKVVKKWKQGQARVVRLGKSDQPLSVDTWMKAWEAESDTEAAIFIDSSQVLSPHWIQWIRGTVSRRSDYRYYEPRVYGVVLERSLDLLTYDREGTWLKNRTQHGWHFQNVGFHANLFFPLHWRMFKNWITTPPRHMPFCPLFNLTLVQQYGGYEEHEMAYNFYVWWLYFSALHGFLAIHPPTKDELAFSKVHSSTSGLYSSQPAFLLEEAPLLVSSRMWGKGWRMAHTLEEVKCNPRVLPAEKKDGRRRPMPEDNPRMRLKAALRHALG